MASFLDGVVPPPDPYRGEPPLKRDWQGEWPEEIRRSIASEDRRQLEVAESYGRLNLAIEEAEKTPEQREEEASMARFHAACRAAGER